MAESFNTYVAQVAEVSHRATAGVKVRAGSSARSTAASRSTRTWSARRWRAASASASARSCKSEITLDRRRGRPGANFDSYDVLRIDEMPEVEVHIVPSTERPTGVGEPGVPPIGPAVANAIRAATGRPVHILPIAKAMQV